jgi:non-heme chloroperoxidase
MSEYKQGIIMTNDAVGIHYVEVGGGPPLVMLPGFSQSAAEFRKQLDGLGSDHRVIAMDHRGHGASEKPEHGYRVSRLAADLRDVLEALELHKVTLVGHSLGCSVIWSYLDLFGGDRVERLVLVDQPAVTAAELVPEGQAQKMGAIFTAEAAYDIAAGLRGDDATGVSRGIVDMMHTRSLSAVDFDWIVEQNMLLPRPMAATLHLDNYSNDFRDVLPRITVPTLVVGGVHSVFGADLAEWIAAQIPGARLRIFSDSEAGSHLMFWENSELFNLVVRKFLSGDHGVS